MNVVVIGGDAIVGQALELLLGGRGHTVRFVNEDLSDEPGLLAEAGLLILAPDLTERRREGLISLAAGASPLAGVPVLELVPYHLQTADGAGRIMVPWPCRAEELERYVASALAGELAEGKVGAHGAARNATGEEVGG